MKNHFIFILAGGRFLFCNKTIVSCTYLAASEIAGKFLYTKKIKALLVQTIKKTNTMKNNRMRNQIIIILTTFVLGLFNTLLLKPEDAGTWKNYLGYGFLVICLINVFWFLIFIRKKSTK